VRLIPQVRGLFWSLLHPVHAFKIRRRNKIIIAELKEAAIKVMHEIEFGIWPETISPDDLDAVMGYTQGQLQKAFFEVVNKERGPL
jgi:hypothetical protein